MLKQDGLLGRASFFWLKFMRNHGWKTAALPSLVASI